MALRDFGYSENSLRYCLCFFIAQTSIYANEANKNSQEPQTLASNANEAHAHVSQK
jgi:hypothetical protein